MSFKIGIIITRAHKLKVAPNITAEIGLLKNILKFPLDNIRDWRKEDSTIGPKTILRINGPIGYEARLK
jgi:hypothetical protein